MSKLLELFNPLSWLQKAATIAIAVVLVWGGLWWFNSKIRDHYQAPLIAEYKAAADAAEAERLKREFVNKERVTDAKDAKIKSLEGLAANTMRVAAANERLQNDLRASAADKTDLAACQQRADTLDAVQRRISEFAQRVVKAADGHVIDLQACIAAWPQ